MSLAPLTSVHLAPAAASLATEAAASPPTRSTPTSPADVKKAAAQFEAILLRQLLGPSLAPLASGGMGGNGSGGGVYGYMLTDILADNLARGGGLGLAALLEKQLGSPSASAAGESALRPTPFSPSP